jgi:hypothetical protein
LADPNVRAKLRTMALQVSSANAVPSPKTIEAVASPDHQAAEKIVSGDIVNDHVAVYVVEVTGGTFTDNGLDPARSTRSIRQRSDPHRRRAVLPCHGLRRDRHRA